jgi:hypothetical protein
MMRLSGRGVVQALVGMRAEVIALSLEEVRGQTLAAVGIVKGQRRAEGGDRNALFRGDGDHIAPGALRILYGLSEEWVEQQI